MYVPSAQTKFDHKSKMSGHLLVQLLPECTVPVTLIFKIPEIKICYTF